MDNSVNLSESCVLVGDLNIPDFYQCYYLNNAHTANVSLLDSFMSINNLSQHSSVLNQNRRLLDLVLTSDNVSCDVSPLDVPFVTEDLHHPSLSVNMQITASSTPDNLNWNQTVAQYNFKTADLRSLYHSMLMIDWAELLRHSNDVNEACENST